jgi:CheY-like chemotaxis protein/HPt (histidine-containing phosphotransfer) domain-containing protein
MMGGDIGVESEVGHGSRFWFNMPIIEAQMPEAPTDILPKTEILRAEDANVLMVEDHPINQMLLSKLLTKLGLKHVTKAENGYEALTALGNATFSLVLMDCQMPELDGYETTRFIREREKLRELPHLPIIAMTANAMVGDREKCLHAGMDDYLSKPIDLPSLRQTLSRWLDVEETYPMTESSATITSHQPIDLTHLRHFTDGDAEEERALFRIFLERSEDNITALQSALAIGANEEWRKSAHLLKGASANLGAKGLSGICAEAEKNHTASIAEKQNYLGSMRQELTQIRHFIETLQGEAYA